MWEEARRSINTYDRFRHRIRGPRLLGYYLIAAALAGCGSSHSSGAAIGPRSVSGISHGIRLTLTVAHSAYPRNAIINASVRVQNQSSHLVTAAGTSCTQMNPLVEDLNVKGTVSFPNSVGWINLIPCVGPTTEDTFMGPRFDRLYQERYVVAMGTNVRAAMLIRGDAKPVVSPTLILHLTSPDPPKVRIGSSPPVLARVKPNFSTHSSLLYLGVDQCQPGSAPYDYLGVFWASVQGRVIRPDCARPLSWRLTVGWVGHSAATVYYKGKSQG